MPKRGFEKFMKLAENWERQHETKKKAEIKQFTKELATLEKIIAAHHDLQPTSEGEKITHQIFLDALTDAAKTLNSIIEFQKAK